jgi:hypothetical protein
MNNESGAAHSCCWPGCARNTFDPLAPRQLPLCWEHLGEAFRLAKSEYQRLGFGGDRKVSAVWAEHLAEEEAKRLERELNKREADAQVYYVQMGERIKIGYTKSLRIRMAQLRTHTRFVLATEPGGREMERMRHLEFAGLRDGRKEEFFPHERLLRHIELIRETYGPPTIT